MRRARGGWELPISESQLGRLTKEMTEAHHDTLPALRADAASLTERIRALGAARRGGLATGGDRAGRLPAGLGAADRAAPANGTGNTGPADAGRRRFLLGAGSLGAAFLLTGCTSAGTDEKGASPPGAPADVLPPRAAADTVMYTAHLRFVALSAALENQAVGAYGSILAAAGAEKFGAVPPAVSTFVTMAMAHHIDHAKAWNTALTDADKPAVTDVPLSNQRAITTALARITSVDDAAKLALQLEDQAAQTYLFASYNGKSAAGIETAATIAPVEAMHVSILRFILGQDPVPEAFLPEDMAATPSLLTV
ncbi:ferritin-like domain-containing protein [Streptomyces sp. NPDC050804]|uniref:ferritin-like domain-containing protein n=1 Tax=Streptomyces sp. NPDC050804 TaxID=3154745 RepID=UPI0034335FE8